MRLAFYTRSADPDRFPGGITTYMTILARELAGMGHVCHILTENPPPAPVPGVRHHPVQIQWLPLAERLLPGLSRARSVSRAAAAVARQYDIQLTEFPNWDYPGLFFPRKFPAVVRLHTGVAQSPPAFIKKIAPGYCVPRIMERRATIRAQALISSTRAHAAAIAENFGLNHNSIHIIPLGLPDDALPGAKQPRSRHEPPLILYVGRMEPRKGAVDLIRAFPLIKKVIPLARLVMIGKDFPRAPGGSLHRDFARKNLPAAIFADIKFPGEVGAAELYDWHCRADLFTAPSLYESFGLIYLEAMKRALPIVATQTGGIPEVINDGTEGLLVRPGCPEKLSAAIVRLLTDEPFRLECATAARKRFERDFSARKMAERTAELYKNTIAAKIHSEL